MMIYKNSSVQSSCSVVSHSLWPYWLQHARFPCLSPSLGVCSNSCPLSQWCHPTISSSVIPFPSCLQSFLASGSFPMSPFFSSGDQSIGVSASASVLPMDIQDWFPLGWTGWISLQSVGLPRVFSCVVRRGCLLWPVCSLLLIWTGGSTPLLCLEGVPDLPVAPQEEAGLTKTFQTWPRGWFHIP